jgi:hypothetical protein
MTCLGRKSFGEMAVSFQKQFDFQVFERSFVIGGWNCKKLIFLMIW